jgi:histidine triad (HIT) family protein
MIEENCIFCKIGKGEIISEKIYESDNFIAILDKFPLAEGHTLIIPKKHFETILDMPNSLGIELLDNIKRISLKLIEEEKAEGFNVIQSNYEVAQQEIPHLHFHIIPRKKGDNLNILKKD